METGVEKRVYAAGRLDRADGIALFTGDDLLRLGRLAQRRRCGGTPADGSGSDGGPVTVAFDADDPAHGALTPGGADADWSAWAGRHREAHAGGLRTAAALWYGLGEDPEDRVDALLRLRELQDATGGFDAVVPVRHRPGSGEPGAPPVDSLRMFAVARLLLDNVPHLRCDLGSHDDAVAQLALQFGVDDLVDRPADGRRVDGAASAADERREALVELVRDAGFRPVERDSRYGVLREHEPAPPLAERRAEPQRIWT